MSKSVNQVTLMGNLTRDPTTREAGSSIVTNFSLALNRSYKDQSGNWIDVTDYVDCVAWAKLAENVDQFLRKGSKCVVIGSLQSRSWEQDGVKRSKTEVLAREVHFMDARPSTDRAETPTPQAPKGKDVDVGNGETINMDEIPF